MPHEHSPAAPAASSPAWRELPGGGAELTLSAVPLRMRSLVLLILAIILSLGPLAAGILIWLDGAGYPSRRSGVIIVAGILGIVASLVFLFVVRSRRRTWEIRLDRSGLRVHDPLGESISELPLSELRHLRVREDSDYARLEWRGSGKLRCLLSGFGSSTPGRVVPPIPHPTAELLERAGLTRTRSTRAPSVTTWSRPVNRA